MKIFFQMKNSYLRWSRKQKFYKNWKKVMKNCGWRWCSGYTRRWILDELSGTHILEQRSLKKTGLKTQSFPGLCSRVPSSSSVASCSTILRSLCRVCLRWYFAWHKSQSVLFPAALADNVYGVWTRHKMIEQTQKKKKKKKKETGQTATIMKKHMYVTTRDRVDEGQFTECTTCS